jgi:hypothetical protein
LVIITSGVVVVPPGIGTEEGVIGGGIGADGEDTIGTGTEDVPTGDGETEVETEGETDVGATDVGRTEVGGAEGETVTLVGEGVCGWQTSFVQVTVAVTTIVLVPVIGWVMVLVPDV